MDKKNLNIVVTEERLESVPLKTYYNLEKTANAPIDFVAHFVANEKGEYFPKEIAIEMVLEGRTVKDVKELAEMLTDSIEETAVPKK